MDDWPAIYDDMDTGERVGVWFMRGVWLLSWLGRGALCLVAAWLDNL
jgi:hypothetical protein